MVQPESPPGTPGAIDRLGQAMVRVPLHFAMAVAGLVAFGIAGGLLGAFEPFWKGAYGSFLLAFGIPLLGAETCLFLLLLQWRSPRSKDRKRTMAVAVAAFVGGAALPVIAACLSNIAWLLRDVAPEQFWFWFPLLGGAVACAALTSSLTRLLAKPVSPMNGEPR